MLEAIGSKDNIQKYVQDVKDKKKVLFGFGHRVYKNYDPRAKIVKKIAFEVF
jgi:citrate synthase